MGVQGKTEVDGHDLTEKGLPSELVQDRAAWRGLVQSGEII